MFQRRNILLAALSLAIAVPLAAQKSHRDRDCDDYQNDWGERVCETREYTLKGSGTLRVDAHPNGGISVIGWDKSEVKVVARVSAWAGSEDEAKDIASQVKVETSDTEIRSTGPNLRSRRGWSVSYEIWAPAKTDLRLSSTNGGLDVEGIRGRLDLETTNGGISLLAVAGDVNAETTNGGINVDLEGSKWDGVGLTARTTNGGVKLRVPEGFNADIEAATTNGGMDFEFPVTIQGRLNRRITTKLGSGGPPIRLETTNGGVTVRRR
jgi:DUF4097 and DUF4098 domain-containing protein YvlB